MTCSPIPLFQGNDKGAALVPPWPLLRPRPSSRGLAHESIFPTPFGAPTFAPDRSWSSGVRRGSVSEVVMVAGSIPGWSLRLFGQIPSLRQLPKNPKNAEKFGFSKFSIQSKREAKPQRFAGTSQLILVQSLLYIKSSTNDCNCTTISFNTIQLAFP